MAHGLLAKKMTVVGALFLYKVSADAEYATTTLDLENCAPVPIDGSNNDVTLRVYLADSDNYQDVDCIGTAIIPPGGHYTISCGLVSPGEQFIIVSDKATVAVRLTGIEEIPVVTTP